MPSLRAEEEWALQMMTVALGLTVVQHDDGSRDGMHDLDVLHLDGTRGAVEVTSAADGELIATWNSVNGRDERWIEPDLDGGWMVSIKPGTIGKRLKRELPRLLRTLERTGIKDLSARRGGRHGRVTADAAALGVVRALQSGTTFPGSIYVTVDLPSERSGGFVEPTTDAVAVWIGAFLREDKQSDVLAKLRRSTAIERHAFVLVPGFSTVSFAVADPLMRDGAPLPTIKPDLPDEVTQVWISSMWARGVGFRWSNAAGWAHFDKLQAA